MKKFKLVEVGRRGLLMDFIRWATPIIIAIIVAHKGSWFTVVGLVVAGYIYHRQTDTEDLMFNALSAGRIANAGIARAVGMSPSTLANVLTDVETNEEYLKELTEKLLLYAEARERTRYCNI